MPVLVAKEQLKKSEVEDRAKMISEMQAISKSDTEASTKKRPRDDDTVENGSASKTVKTDEKTDEATEAAEA